MISIITPVFNGERHLEQCVRSVIDQNCPNWELLLVDDGSTDGSGEMCDRFAAEDSRIKVFHKSNSGVSAARNLALEHVQGRFIMFLDSDDWLDRSALDTLLQNIGDADLIKMQYCCSEADRELGGGEDRTEIYGKESFLGGDLLTGAVWCYMMRSDLIRKRNLKFDVGLKIAEDKLFVLRYLEECRKIAATGRKLYFYRDNPAGAMRNISAQSMIDVIEHFSAYKKEHPEASLHCDKTLLSYVFDLAHKTETASEEVVRCWHIADIRILYPGKSCGVKLFYRISRVSPGLAVRLVRLTR